MRILRAAALLAVLAALAGCPAGAPEPRAVATPPARDCPSAPGSATAIAGEPALWRASVEARDWTDRRGCRVRIDVITDRRGPAHCDFDAARVIVTGEPVGALMSRRAEESVVYVRDPTDAFGDPVTAAGFDPDATLPAAAEDTGFRQGASALWAVPGDRSAIYLVTPAGAERWPRDPGPALCA